jgi:bifunctional DNA-binding transcriptional regulator/antitoxin component of YhaV-PrlF toxin-antitoxin module
MGILKKFNKKIVELDERGRITLPKDLREGISSFAIEAQRDGSLHLVPQKTVSLGEAELLESLKKSVSEFKKGQTKKVPAGWID